MSNTELTVLLAAVFVWGAFSGILFYKILVADLLERELKDAARRERRWQRLAQEHRGTPYRPETVAAARLPEDHEWSVKVPAKLEVVQ